ncbi:MAG: hypothetical protein V4749_17840 [Pseudomonadota bacterium]
MSREQFEKEYAEDHDMPIETFSQYRMGDSYRLPMIAKCWRFYQKGEAQAGREAVVIDYEKAARRLAYCMEYPWHHMPEKGKNSMREHAKAVVESALTATSLEVKS